MKFNPKEHAILTRDAVKDIRSRSHSTREFQITAANGYDSIICLRNSVKVIDAKKGIIQCVIADWIGP